MFDDMLAWSKRESISFRLWAKDPTIFGQTQPLMMDWLDEPREILSQIEEWKKRVAELKNDFTTVVLLGMGGSSLAVKVFQEILGTKSSLNFFVLDTIHPDAIEKIEDNIDLRRSLFIVASKSGSTLEPNLLYRHFWQSLEKQGEEPAQHFIAITDPETSLAKEALEKNFLVLAKGNAWIGGRYSALSIFGILPAFFLGIDAELLLKRAVVMANNCGPSIPEEHNPAFLLGLFLGTNAILGRDQLAFHFSKSLQPFGMWLEQLIAESLGKDEGGIVPLIDGSAEYLAFPKAMHCIIELADEPIDAKLKEKIKNSGLSYVQLDLASRDDLGAEMFRWEVAVSLAATLLKSNPFDQPDVEKSKQGASKILALMKNGQFSFPKHPCYSSESLEIFDEGSDKETINILARFFSAIKKGDYCAVLSYLDENEENSALLKAFKQQIVQRAVPTLLQSGPRYLHSTGQLFKGGKNNGHFILITGPYAKKIMSQGGLIFGDIHLSQALGDYQAMLDQKRHILHIHLKDISMGFRELLALSKHM